jgi:sugar-specific transcriptional regulator TrmB
MKDYKIIKRHPHDLYFRLTTEQLVNNAEKEIHVVTGEFSILYFSAVREAFRKAVNRGVDVKAYLGKCDEDTINRSLVIGIDVYRGDKLPRNRDHYLVVDRKHILVSKKHIPYDVGSRHGPLYENKPQIAAKKIKTFEKLIKEECEHPTEPKTLEQRTKLLLAELHN